MLKFTSDHEWILVEGETATIGVTNYAQKALGDVVFVELPEVDTAFEKGDEMCVVESVKAASEVYAPVSGTVIETNPTLEAEPALVNSSPDDDGWFVKLAIRDSAELDDLMDEAAYAEMVATLD